MEWRTRYLLRCWNNVEFDECQTCPHIDTTDCDYMCYHLCHMLGFLPSEYQELPNPDDLPDYGLDPMRN